MNVLYRNPFVSAYIPSITHLGIFIILSRCAAQDIKSLRKKKCQGPSAWGTVVMDIWNSEVTFKFQIIVLTLPCFGPRLLPPAFPGCQECRSHRKCVREEIKNPSNSLQWWIDWANHKQPRVNSVTLLACPVPQREELKEKVEELLTRFCLGSSCLLSYLENGLLLLTCTPWRTGDLCISS